jgi:hypothetical protein
MSTFKLWRYGSSIFETREERDAFVSFSKTVAGKKWNAMTKSEQVRASIEAEYPKGVPTSREHFAKLYPERPRPWEKKEAA